MTTKVIFINRDKPFMVSGTPEHPLVTVLRSNESDVTVLLDNGASTTIVDSVETGGGARKTRTFILNAQHAEFDPKKEGVYLPFVKEILFE